MPFDLSTLPAEHLAPTALYLIAAAAYVAYHYGASAAAVARRLDVDPGSPLAVGLQRGLGAVLLGVIPAVAAALLLSPADLGALNLGSPSAAWCGAVAGVYLLALPAIALSSRDAEHREAYPQVRAARWTPRLHATNAATWALYLAGYELFFRGVLLAPLAVWLGPWPAIAIVTALYTYAHLPKRAGETAGCVLLGALFGALALGSGSVLLPFGLHLAIALTNDALSARTRIAPAQGEALSHRRRPPGREKIIEGVRS